MKSEALCELSAAETAKSLKIEKIIKEYELQAAAAEANALAEDEEDIILDIEMLLDESMALLSELVEDDDKSPMAGAFAFSSANGAFELLERMDGDELKEFFETALDEVLLSVEAALQELSPDAAQGLANLRYKFANHRLVELQQTFERLVIARDAQERQLAFETAVVLFQLAQEEAIAKESSKEPETDTTTAISRGSFQMSDGDWACPNPGQRDPKTPAVTNPSPKEEVILEDLQASSNPVTGRATLVQDEKRDGAGGGFNERQERVASTRTEVGEDGYDDFGMKKKCNLPTAPKRF
eukprot:jgi/Phyca11/19074/fgenesh1_pg.PHYCAscaffold_43_\